jgi:beta-phosphoglucomutase-like phosphatase (HAD superfamily)
MAAPANIRAVIFDMDGVLTDSEPLINKAAITMFGELGLQVNPPISSLSSAPAKTVT